MDIPQDIIDNVIAAVGDNTKLLKNCSLVSSSFLLPCRKQLFSEIALVDIRRCQGIYQLLVQNPVIKTFVRTIVLSTGRSDNWVNGTSLLAILRLQFCCVERFALNFSFSSWDNFSSEIEDALLNIINSSSLQTFSLKGTSEVPMAFFFRIAHLSTLKLNSISPYYSVDKNPNSLARAASKGVEPIACQTMVDKCAWDFKTDDKNWVDIDTKPKFMPFLCRPRFLEIYIDFHHSFLYNAYNLDILPFLMDSLCISLTSPATLEHLEFNIFFHQSDYKSFFYETLRDAWSHLDSITTYSTSSQLQRVDINIEYMYFLEDDDAFSFSDELEESGEDKIEKAVLDGLPLLRSEGILQSLSAPRLGWFRISGKKNKCMLKLIQATIHLSRLELNSISPYDFVDQNSSSLARAASKGVVELVASHAVIDRCVWSFKAHHGDEVPVDAKSISMPFLCRLRFLEIHIEFYRSSSHDVFNLDILSFLMDSLCISLTSPATLEHLEFNIWFHGSEYQSFYGRLRDAWSHLDSITAYSTSSQLQRVDVNIKLEHYHYLEYGSSYGGFEEKFDKDKIEKAVLDGLPLLRAEGILFVNVNSPVG